MEFVSPRFMGYDRAITVFSPEGRLHQVEYADKCVDRAGTSIGIKTREGIVLIGYKGPLVDELHEEDSSEKVYQIDNHIGVVMTGIIGDGRKLIEEARVHAQVNRVTYNEAIDTESLVIFICNINQWHTQYAGIRPFGVAFLVGGVDHSGPRLYITAPSGAYAKVKADALGEGKDIVRKILKSKYKEDMSLEDAILLGVKALKKVVGKDLSLQRVDMGLIEAKAKKFRKLSKKEIKRYF